MLLVYLIINFQTSFALLLTTENRVATRNITCQQSSSNGNVFLSNCEACLVTTRNYAIDTTLSLTGKGPQGGTYACLQANEVETYHENLARECRYFPDNTLNGYDDFCIAAPWSFVRGSYRACICITNNCNTDYSQCVLQKKPNRDAETPIFTKTLKPLTDQVRCYRPYDDFNSIDSSNLTQLCSSTDANCQNYIVDHGVLCLISIDKTNQITTRQTLISSLYTDYIIKYKTQFCDEFVTTSKSILFSQCQSEDAVCMCAANECNKDMETCRTTNGINKLFPISHLFIFLYLILI